MDCFGTYFTHVQTCNVTFVFKVLRNGLLRYILYTCQTCNVTFVFKVLRNGLLRYILYTCVTVQSATQWTASILYTCVTHVHYGTDCGTYFTHETCNVTHVHSATEQTALVHTLHMTESANRPPGIHQK